MHLTFPDRSDRFTREELRCVAAALGFYNDIFRRHIPEANTRRSYVETKVLMNLIERKVFNHDLHETYNMHDGVYNVKVLEKSLIALSKRLVTFSELKTIRIAFEVYECQDLSGMEICSHVILRTLKMCDRVVSPRKLMDFIKHMPRDIPDRLTLYEFMELLPLCERISDVKAKLQKQAEAVKRRRRSNVSELADFHEILVQEEKKQTDFLDDDYEQSVLRPSFEDKPTWRVPPEEIINNEEWMKHVLTYRQVAGGVDATIGQTNRQVVRARTGTPGRDTAFQDWNFSSTPLDLSTKSERVPEMYQRCTEPAEDHGTLHDAIADSHTRKHSLPTPDCARPHVNKTRQYCWTEQAKESSRRSKLSKNNILVTKEALQDTDTKIINLLWDLEMKDTLLKIRSKDQVPKIRRKVSRQENEKNNSLETSTLPEFDDEVAAKHKQKIPTISPRDIPTSASEICTQLNARSRKRDQLLSRGSFRKNTIHSFHIKSKARCIETKPT